jgi:signal transduction histidine kinase
MRMSIAGLGTVGAFALLVAYAAFVRVHAVDERAAAAFEAGLREISTLNFRRSSELLLSRTGLVRNYDGLAAVELELRRVHEQVRQLPSFLGAEEAERLQARLLASSSARADAERTVELFKRELAILRNSTGFLTTLAREVARFEPVTAEGVTLVRAFDALLRDLLALQVDHDRVSVELAQRALVRLRIEAPRAAEWRSADLALILRHGEVVVEKSVLIDELLRQLEVLPTAQTADESLSIYLSAHRAALGRDARHGLLSMTLVFVGAAMVGLYVILRLRRAARELLRSGVELERAVLSLREERNKQTELAELKSRLVSTTSHEFRTPLSVILSSAEMLSAYGSQWTTQKIDQHLGRIRGSAFSMTRMLEDVLLLGRAESGRMEYTPAPFLLAAFCVDLVQSSMLAHGVEERIVVTLPQADVTVVADEGLLRHALGNLLSNALKYSPEDRPVELKVAVRSDAVEFEVKDRGIGIPSEDQRHLFSSFHRGSNVGRIRGSGLGLSIVKRAIELQHGSVSLESTVGEGTQVIVRVPVRVRPGEAA